MPQDVSTHWNSMYDMLKFALDYWIALDAIAGKRDMKLQKYELKDAEWGIARQLQDILEVCFDSKLLYCLDNSSFSSWNMLHSFFLEQHPILQWLSPSWTILINILLQVCLTYHSQRPSVWLLLWASILSISTIQWLISQKYIELQWVRFQYYFLTTLFWLTHLLVLHPHHKLDYFKKAKWDNKWINMARQIVWNEFERSYKDCSAADLTTSNADHNSELKKVCF